MDPPRRPWTDPGFNKSQPSLAPRPDRTTRTYPEPPALIARRNNEGGASAGPASASGEDNNDNNDNGNGNNNNSDHSYDDNQGFVEDASVGSIEEDEQEDVDSDAGGADGSKGKGKGKGKDPKRQQAAAAVASEDPCPICQDDLPEKERGILKCGHVFCFVCIHKWSKKETKCPACRRKFSTISKTLPLADLREELVRRVLHEKDMTKAQQKKAKRRLERYKKPKPFVAAKTVRVRPRSQADEQRRLQANAPHPQAPGGFLHVPVRFGGAPAAAPASTPRYVSRWNSLVDAPPSPPLVHPLAPDEGGAHHQTLRATAEGGQGTHDPDPAGGSSWPVPMPPVRTDPHPSSWSR